MAGKNRILVAAPLAVLLLELLPCGAVLRFGRMSTAGDVGFFRETFSYFSPTPFGYGNIGPLLTALLTCLLLAAAALSALREGSMWLRPLCMLSGAACLTSLLPLLLGPAFGSAVGVVITLLLAAECIGSYRMMQRSGPI